jgi:phytanoyl-CoA hydroxylase
VTAAVPARHELNTTFAWSEHAGQFRRVRAEQARQYDESGFFLLEGALTPPEVAELIAAIDPLEARTEAALRERAGGRFFIARADEITFSTHLVIESPLLREFTSSRLFADLGADLIGTDVRLYWDQAVYKKPGTESPFPWHQDNGYAFVEPQQYLTCWVALTDATEENGCPWVVPGLHRLGTLAHDYSDIGFVCLREPEGAVPVPAPAGSIVVFSSLTPHSTGPNRTDAVRKSYIVQFAPSGAEVIRAAPGRSPTRTRADDAARQYEILRDGALVTREGHRPEVERRRPRPRQGRADPRGHRADPSRS